VSELVSVASLYYTPGLFLIIWEYVDGDIHIWDLKTGDPLYKFRPHNIQRGAGPLSMAWFSGGESIYQFATGYGGELKFWKLRRISL